MDKIATLKEELTGLETVLSDKQKTLDDFMAGFASDQSKFTTEEDEKSVTMEADILKAKKDITDKEKEISAKENFERLQSERLERQRAQDKAYVAANRQSDEEKAVKSFTFHRALKLISKDKKLDGAEKDIHQLAEAEAEKSGHPTSGQFSMPLWMVEMRNEKQIKYDNDRGYSKAMSVGTATTGGHGVATTTMPLIPVLRPRLKVVEAGTRITNGLRNNLKFYRHTTVETASMNSEIGAGNEVTPTFDTFTADPKRIDAYTTISKLLLIQNPEVGEQFIRRNLEFALQKRYDQQVLSGSGAGNEMEGLDNISGLGSVAWNASDPYASLVDLETAITQDDADVESMKHLVHPIMKGSLKKERIDAGSGIFVWGATADGPVGYPGLVSTQVPINTTPDPDEYTHYFGNWADGSLYFWGVVDFVRDEYNKTAQVDFVINMWADYGLDHPQSMALITDAVA